MGYLFEWNTLKAASSATKHGVTFDEACTVFGDPLAILLPDPDHSVAERYVLLGVCVEPPPPAGCGPCGAAAAYTPHFRAARNTQGATNV